MAETTYICDLCGHQAADRAAISKHLLAEHGISDTAEVGALTQQDGILTLRSGDDVTVIDLEEWLHDALKPTATEQ